MFTSSLRFCVSPCTFSAIFACFSLFWWLTMESIACGQFSVGSSAVIVRVEWTLFRNASSQCWCFQIVLRCILFMYYQSARCWLSSYVTEKCVAFVQPHTNIYPRRTEHLTKQTNNNIHDRGNHVIRNSDVVWTPNPMTCSPINIWISISHSFVSACISSHCLFLMTVIYCGSSTISKNLIIYYYHQWRTL